MLKVLRSELVELVIPGVAGGNTGTKFKFPDLPKLRNAKAKGIEIYTATDVPFSQIGNAVATGAQIKNIFLTLFADGDLKIFQVPAVSLHRVENNTPDPYTRLLFMLDEKLQIVWDKSYIEFANGQAPANTSDLSVLFNFYYEDIAK